MRLILLKNKENFAENSGSVFKKFSAVIEQNQPWLVAPKVRLPMKACLRQDLNNKQCLKG